MYFGSVNIVFYARLILLKNLSVHCGIRSLWLAACGMI